MKIQFHDNSIINACSRPFLVFDRINTYEEIRNTPFGSLTLNLEQPSINSIRFVQIMGFPSDNNIWLFIKNIQKKKQKAILDQFYEEYQEIIK